MTIEIRPTKPGEHRAASDVTGIALMFPAATDEEWAKREAGWVESDSVTAWDGDRCVGNARAFTTDTTVPGGARLPMSAVTSVGVLPTYTRRGLLSGMMERLLRDARADGRVLAGLRATEAVIYRRFGFGVAGEAASVRIRARAARPVHGVPSGTMRLLQKDEIVAILPDLYDRCARRRTGSMSRPRWYLDRGLEDVMGGTKPTFVAVHVDPAGTMDGYVKYAIAWDESENDDVGRGMVQDLFGADAAVERDLWAYLLGIDLIDEWRAEERPIDESIRFALADMRAHRVRDVWDEQWLRILDVDATFAPARIDPANGQVVIGVTDPWFSDNVGAWRVEPAGEKPTDAAPDLEVPIDVLSAVYLGGTSWRELADAGQVGVHRADAVDDADSLFTEFPTPFCGTFY